MRVLSLIGLFLSLAIAGELAQAQESGPATRPELFELDLELGLEHSDNRARTSPRSSDETALVARALLDLYRSGDRLTLRAAGHLDQRVPLHGPFDRDFQANLGARLNWHLIDDSLDWIIENVASGLPIDVTGQLTPDNRQQTNVFSTGPRWVFRPGEAWSGLFDARYIHSHAEDSTTFNSDRLALAARLVRQIGGGRQVSLGAEASEVWYRDEAFDEADYQRLDLVGRYRASRPELDWDIAIGRSRIDLDRGERLEGNLARARMIWSPDERHRLVLSASHELSDSVRQLAADINQLELPIAGNRRLRVGNEFYVLDTAAAGWRTRLGAVDGSVNLAWRDYQFELDPTLDVEEHGLALGLIWRMSNSFELDAQVGLERRHFRVDDQRDTDVWASLFLGRRFNPRWSGRVGTLRHQRDSNLLGGNSRETIVAVYLTYHAGR